ncbi:hypothetical protein PIB30_119119 [Stylosanthes scabra]|uniref:Reverse transcriptase domain-containing protein n=1 Tax=Stylosanthes scabra TaxID=79078 RepID=A0ABU6SPY5_9FABA|nr:hypothetical protein [Stylosanthes scabra]
MFADDLLLFFKASKTQVQRIMLFLNLFGQASGLKVNLEKSNTVCSKNIFVRRRSMLAGVSNIRFAQDLGKYLGVNLNHPQASRAVCMEAVEKIRNRFAGWKGRLLNRAGRLCLIKSVASSLLTYQIFCPKAKAIWEKLGTGLTSRYATLDFASWIRHNLKANEFAASATIWWIWRDRNNDIFNPSEAWTIQKVVVLIRQLCSKLSKALLPSISLTPTAVSVVWMPPSFNTIKINCDISLFEQQGLAGFGCILRDNMGVWVTGCSASIPEDSILRCQLLSIWCSLILACDHGYQDIVCETDCLEAYLLANQNSSAN